MILLIKLAAGLNDKCCIEKELFAMAYYPTLKDLKLWTPYAVDIFKSIMPPLSFKAIPYPDIYIATAKTYPEKTLCCFQVLPNVFSFEWSSFHNLQLIFRCW